MKITQKQLRNIIREEIKKTVSGKKNLSEAMTRITEDEIAAWKRGDWGYVSGDSLTEAALPVANVIDQYRENPRAWSMAKIDFEDMADGGSGEGIRDKYYPGWRDEDFQAVLDALDES